MLGKRLGGEGNLSEESKGRQRLSILAPFHGLQGHSGPTGAPLEQMRAEQQSPIPKAVRGFVKNVLIGTSGWSYKSWQAHFYPPHVPANQHLRFYVTQFPTVEINLTFYRLPTTKMAEGWRAAAPKGFVFAVKGSRFITHMKKLANLDGGLKKYFDRLTPLKQKIGVVLWQLPPFLKLDPQRLERFLKRLPESYEHAIEFRHPSWQESTTFQLLQHYHIAHVAVSSQAMPMNLSVTSRIVYIRFHGLAGGAAHDYIRSELKPWADHICQQAKSGKKVFAYFNNDANERAPANAKLLMSMVKGEAQQAFAEAA
jgi:uncharacterized protein YecE (DUF72 family)